MKAYFLRRLLLVPFTLLGVTIVVFTVSRWVPGGPIETAMQQASQAQEGGGGSGGGKESGGSLDEDKLEAMEEEYGYDKPSFIAYLQWLGAWKKERQIAKGEFKKVTRLREDLVGDPKLETLVTLSGSGRQVLVRRSSPDAVDVESATYLDSGESILNDCWQVRIETPDDRILRFARRYRLGVKEEGERLVVDSDLYSAKEYAYRAVIFKGRFSGLLQGDLGRSSTYNDRVIDMILERIPIALYFGILTAIITYGVCLPLGVVKALKHRTMIDSVTSVLIFVGYSVPGFALGAVLLVHFGARADIFPLAGLVSPEFDTLSPGAKLKDLAMHTALPLLSYVVAGFAVTTMMMKNNLMDNLAADYVRTAVSKGVSFKSAVFKHAFRNSFIPIATGLGNLIALIVGGSMLIEQVFDIPGFGLLQYQAVKDVDINVMMGTLTIAAFLMLVGNILSDFIVSLVDPRIKFQ
ncbi:ABC transporter permease [Sulfuriroseicoccus oceanibius]|uniref:ABC transporter permease n=1 Tax=Sulfuriroseicoccus oceanibius TaxID=2707525 RepID=A0A6B3L7S5_9BACT|nr:ABC transporter permease [Sulfuriroseicoccus oceanibius]QQL44743.1 ABC transporter permease [Sulfuriroseicoccus oceanibius]